MGAPKVTRESFWEKVDDAGGPDACWPWTGPKNSNGRGRPTWRGRKQYAYRVAWELTHGEPIPDDLLACHTCDNGECVNPAHIFIGTQADNVADAKAKGRLFGNRGRVRGMNNPASKLPDHLVVQAVAEWNAGIETQTAIAAKYGVSRAAIWRWAQGTFRTDAFRDSAA